MLEEKTYNKNNALSNSLLDRLSKADCLVALKKAEFNRNERAEIGVIYNKLLKERGIEIKDNTESRLNQKEIYLEAIGRYIQTKKAILVS